MSDVHFHVVGWQGAHHLGLPNFLRAREINMNVPGLRSGGPRPEPEPGTHRSDTPVDPGKPFGPVDVVLRTVPVEVVERFERRLSALVWIGVLALAGGAFTVYHLGAKLDALAKIEAVMHGGK